MYNRRVLGIGTNLIRYNLHPVCWEGALKYSLSTAISCHQFPHTTVVHGLYQCSGYLTVHGILQHMNLLQCLALCQCPGLPNVGLFAISSSSNLTISSSSFASNRQFEEYSSLEGNVFLVYTNPLMSAQVSKLQTYNTAAASIPREEE